MGRQTQQVFLHLAPEIYKYNYLLYMHFSARLFIDALCSPAGKGLTS